MQRIIKVQDKTIEYTLTRKKVKNINMRVKMDGSVQVSARHSVSVKTIDQFVCSQADFIWKAQEKYKKMAREVDLPIHYISGETIPFMGRRVPLVVKKGRPEQLFFSKGALILQMWNNEDEARRGKAFERGMRHMQEVILSGVFDTMFQKVGKWNIDYPHIRFRSMKSRWGSCQPRTKVVTLNRQLIMYPREFIEYVVVHELAHFLQPNHSKAFYEKVAEILPDWKVRSKMNRVLDHTKEEIDYEN